MSLIGFGMLLGCMLAMAVYSITVLLKISEEFERYDQAANVTRAFNADIEDVFEARVAALAYRATGDAGRSAEVISNIDEVLNNSPLSPFLGRDPELDRAAAEIRGQLEQYETAFADLLQLDGAFTAIMDDLRQRGPEIRRALSDIRESAYADGDVEAAYRSSVVQENLLLGRYYSGLFAVQPKPEYIARATDHFGTARTASDVLLRELQNPVRRGLAEKVQADLETITGQMPQLLKNRQTATALSRDVLDAIGAAVSDLTDVEVDKMDQSRMAAADSTERLIANANTLLPVVAGGALLFGLALAATVLTITRRRFASLIWTTEELAQGRIDVDIVGTEKKHEIGRMTQALTVFRDTERERRAQADRESKLLETRDMVDCLNHGLAQLSNGDLSVRIDATVGKDFETLKDNFNASMARLQSIMSDLIGSSDTILNSAGSLASASENLAQRTENQASALAQTTATVGQIKEAVDNTARSSQNGAAQVAKALEQSQRGKDVVDKTVKAMSRIKQRSSEIAHITGVINDIAFQTNLLALNAGVEAARAGESGRGFAVVAAEVRGLAQRAGEAAEEINQLIQASGEVVAEGAKLADETSGALSDIAEAVETLNDAVHQINDAASSQAQGLEEINLAMTELDQLTQQNAAMVEEATAASVELRNESASMQSKTSVFTLSSSGSAPMAMAG